MNTTHKLLEPFMSDSLNKLSLEELSSAYKYSSETKILATSFDKVFGLIYLIKEEYWGFNDEDIASWSLEKLHTCLLSYNGSVKFTTYYAKVLRNKFREETEKMNYKKRKSILVSLNDVMEEGITDVYNLIELLLPKNLTSNERSYCMLASKGYDNGLIAEALGVSRMTISNIRKSLKVKLITLQN